MENDAVQRHSCEFSHFHIFPPKVFLHIQNDLKFIPRRVEEKCQNVNCGLIGDTEMAFLRISSEILIVKYVYGRYICLLSGCDVDRMFSSVLGGSKPIKLNLIFEVELNGREAERDVRRVFL